RKLTSDVDDALVIGIDDLRARQIFAALERDLKEDVDRISHVDVSATYDRVYFRPLGDRRSRRLADQMGQGDLDAGLLAQLGDVTLSTLDADFDRPVHGGIARRAPGKKRHFAPGGQVLQAVESTHG